MMPYITKCKYLSPTLCICNKDSIKNLHLLVSVTIATCTWFCHGFSTIVPIFFSASAAIWQRCWHPHPTEYHLTPFLGWVVFWVNSTCKLHSYLHSDNHTFFSQNNSQLTDTSTSKLNRELGQLMAGTSVNSSTRLSERAVWWLITCVYLCFSLQDMSQVTIFSSLADGNLAKW